MWKALIDGLLAVLTLVRRTEENRLGICELEHRMRDLEEAMKLVVQEQRHAAEIAASEREKLLLRLDAVLAKNAAALPAKKRRKSK